ncbi:hypothetical protein Z042_21220 [Chania multitudinisentens RB-25]|uniref:Glycosyl transferase family 1 domain-containing protein n=1 Tax=Chania multitudinisentens RB-25 TaxID=1441930 RepID=W0LGU4_9GAMM|nr:glycosyltransferase family 4 protein [Chania multitudinisentens]AHG22951.1 hypothetical protein Z042_21220 [Chania multitudinisentens RB-25]
MSLKETVNSKMVFIDSYYKGLYGAPRSMLALAKGLADEGNAVEIITTKYDILATEAKKEGVKCVIFNTPSVLLMSRRSVNLFNRFYYVFTLFFFWISIVFKYSLGKYNTICVNDIRSFLLFMPLLFLNGKKIIWYIRINDRVKFITKIAAFLSSKIVIISSDCINVFSLKEQEVYKKKIFLVHTGFQITKPSIDAFLNKSHADTDKVFITVGSICKRKNQIAIIEAFSNIDAENKYLYILGSPATEADYSYNDELLFKIKMLNIADKVSLIPHTPYVLNYLRMADFFLFASHQEGLPRVVVEALLSGCYVISAKVDGVNDIIKNKNLGIVTTYSASSGFFAEEFLSLIENVYEMDHDKEYRRHFIEENFSLAAYVKNFINVVNVQR